MRAAAVGLLLALAAGPVGAQAPVPGACAASPDDVALTKATAAKIVRRPVLTRLFAQAHIAEGCGVWRITITPQGAVGKLELVRGQGRPDYERLLRPLLMKTTFQPSDSEWVGMMRINIKQPD